MQVVNQLIGEHRHKVMALAPVTSVEQSILTLRRRQAKEDPDHRGLCQ